MIALTVEKCYGMATARVRVRAASIEQALRLVGEDARVVFPIDPELFFAGQDTPESIEVVPFVGNKKAMWQHDRHSKAACSSAATGSPW